MTSPKSVGLLAWAYGDSLVKGGRGVLIARNFTHDFFLLALPEFSPLFCPSLGGQLPPPPAPPPLPRTPMPIGNEMDRWMAIKHKHVIHSHVKLNCLPLDYEVLRLTQVITRLQRKQGCNQEFYVI